MPMKGQLSGRGVVDVGKAWGHIFLPRYALIKIFYVHLHCEKWFYGTLDSTRIWQTASVLNG